MIKNLEMRNSSLILAALVGVVAMATSLALAGDVCMFLKHTDFDCMNCCLDKGEGHKQDHGASEARKMCICKSVRYNRKREGDSFLFEETPTKRTASGTVSGEPDSKLVPLSECRKSFAGAHWCDGDGAPEQSASSSPPTAAPAPVVTSEVLKPQRDCATISQFSAHECNTCCVELQKAKMDFAMSGQKERCECAKRDCGAISHFSAQECNTCCAEGKRSKMDFAMSGQMEKCVCYAETKRDCGSINHFNAQECDTCCVEVHKAKMDFALSGQMEKCACTGSRAPTAAPVQYSSPVPMPTNLAPATVAPVLSSSGGCSSISNFDSLECHNCCAKEPGQTMNFAASDQRRQCVCSATPVVSPVAALPGSQPVATKAPATVSGFFVGSGARSSASTTPQKTWTGPSDCGLIDSRDVRNCLNCCMDGQKLLYDIEASRAKGKCVCGTSSYDISIENGKIRHH